MTTYRVNVAGKDYLIAVEENAAKTINGEDASFVKTEDAGSNRFSVHANGQAFHLAVIGNGTGYEIMAGGISLHVSVQNDRPRGARKPLDSTKHHHGAEVLAPMPALVKSVLVETGEKISTGQTLVVLEAMKMENDVRSGREGVVTSIAVKPGMTVEKDQLLFTIE